jgi:hypothetical protein
MTGKSGYGSLHIKIAPEVKYLGRANKEGSISDVPLLDDGKVYYARNCFSM